MFVYIHSFMLGPVFFTRSPTRRCCRTISSPLPAPHARRAFRETLDYRSSRTRLASHPTAFSFMTSFKILAYSSS